MDQILGGPRGPVSDAVDRICKTLGAPEGGLPSATQIVGSQQAAEAAVAAATAVAFPAGGTGTAAGGWDTAGNRDLAIARFTALLADVAALRVTVNSLLAKLRTHGLIAP